VPVAVCPLAVVVITAVINPFFPVLEPVQAVSQSCGMPDNPTPVVSSPIEGEGKPTVANATALIWVFTLSWHRIRLATTD